MWCEIGGLGKEEIVKCCFALKVFQMNFKKYEQPNENLAPTGERV